MVRSHYGNGFIKQYVRDHLILRTEAASNNVNDYGVNKAVANLPALRKAVPAINDNYLEVQQDIVETFVDRGQLRKLAEPTITLPESASQASSSITLGSLPSRTRWCASRTSPPATHSPPPKSTPPSSKRSADHLHHTLASLRYDLSKLRAKGLVAKLPNSRRYQLLPQGYSICLVFLKLFQRVYAPLTAGVLSLIKADAWLQSQRRSQLDRLYQRVVDDLDTLIRAVALKAA